MTRQTDDIDISRYLEDLFVIHHEDHTVISSGAANGVSDICTFASWIEPDVRRALAEFITSSIKASCSIDECVIPQYVPKMRDLLMSAEIILPKSSLKEAIREILKATEKKECASHEPERR